MESDHSNGNFSLMYIGKFGGANYQTRDYLIELMSKGGKPYLITRQGNDCHSWAKKNMKPEEICALELRSNLCNVLNFYSRILILKKIKKFVTQNHITLVIVTMYSFFDVPILYLLNKLGVRINLIVHDATHHRGELWPNRFTLKRRQKYLNRVYFLSEYVANKINRQIRGQINFQFIRFPNSNYEVFNRNVPEIDYLVIGRGKKYKGIEFLINNWPAQQMGANAVIAGEGISKFKSRASFKVLDKWLTEEEFIFLIQNSKTLIFPYIEASQSGVIEIAKCLNKKILASNAGGLPEQLAGYAKYSIYEVGNADDFKVRLSELNKNIYWKNEKNKFGSNFKSIEELLILDGVNF